MLAATTMVLESGARAHSDATCLCHHRGRRGSGDRGGSGGTAFGFRLLRTPVCAGASGHCLGAGPNICGTRTTPA